jgi:hypothetical protein
MKELASQHQNESIPIIIRMIMMMMKLVCRRKGELSRARENEISGEESKE